MVNCHLESGLFICTNKHTYSFFRRRSDDPCGNLWPLMACFFVDHCFRGRARYIFNSRVNRNMDLLVYVNWVFLFSLNRSCCGPISMYVEPSYPCCIASNINGRAELSCHVHCSHMHIARNTVGRTWRWVATLPCSNISTHYGIVPSCWLTSYLPQSYLLINTSSLSVVTHYYILSVDDSKEFATLPRC